jgi:serine/threonine protein kinase
MDYEVESFMKADIFSYGLVVHYMVTGDKPWAIEESHAAANERMDVKTALPEFPKTLGTGPLKDLYVSCLCLNPLKRPTAGEIISKKFQGKRNFFKIITISNCKI